MGKLLRLTVLAGLMVLFGAVRMGWCSVSVPRKPELATADADVVCRRRTPHHAPSLQARLLLWRLPLLTQVPLSPGTNPGLFFQSVGPTPYSMKHWLVTCAVRLTTPGAILKAARAEPAKRLSKPSYHCDVSPLDQTCV
jgi:hypothetical protein